MLTRPSMRPSSRWTRSIADRSASPSATSTASGCGGGRRAARGPRPAPRGRVPGSQPAPRAAPDPPPRRSPMLREPPVTITTLPVSDTAHAGMPTVSCLQVLLRNPSTPISRPMPLCLVTAERRVSASKALPVLTFTVPARNRRATASARSRSAGMHGARETVDRVIGDPHCVVVAVVRDHREHGPEDFLLRDPHAVVDAGKESRLDIEPAGQPRRNAAAGHDLAPSRFPVST